MGELQPRENFRLVGVIVACVSAFLKHLHTYATLVLPRKVDYKNVKHSESGTFSSPGQLRETEKSDAPVELNVSYCCCAYCYIVLPVCRAVFSYYRCTNSPH